MKRQIDPGKEKNIRTYEQIYNFIIEVRKSTLSKQEWGFIRKNEEIAFCFLFPRKRSNQETTTTCICSQQKMCTLAAKSEKDFKVWKWVFFSPWRDFEIYSCFFALQAETQQDMLAVLPLTTTARCSSKL